MRNLVPGLVINSSKCTWRRYLFAWAVCSHPWIVNNVSSILCKVYCLWRLIKESFFYGSYLSPISLTIFHNTKLCSRRIYKDLRKASRGRVHVRNGILHRATASLHSYIQSNLHSNSKGDLVLAVLHICGPWYACSLCIRLQQYAFKSSAI